MVVDPRVRLVWVSGTVSGTASVPKSSTVQPTPSEQKRVKKVRRFKIAMVEFGRELRPNIGCLRKPAKIVSHNLQEARESWINIGLMAANEGKCPCSCSQTTRLHQRTKYDAGRFWGKRARTNRMPKTVDRAKRGLRGLHGQKEGCQVWPARIV